MGYTTCFDGGIWINPPLDINTVKYIRTFNQTRRMKRNVDILQEKFHGENGFEGSYGIEGEYFIGGTGNFGQDEDPSIIDYNLPPATQPGLWCQWIVTQDGECICWDEREKFYHSVEWMQYIIDNFIAPKGHICNGKIYAEGEDSDDKWNLIVKNNQVSTEDIVFITETELEEAKSIKYDISSDIEDILENLKELDRIDPLIEGIIKKLETLQLKVEK